MRALLVEDDLRLGKSLLHALQDDLYSVDWVRDCAAGWRAVSATEYAVALLDLGARKMDGLALLQQLRTVGNQVPVLTLADRDDFHAHIPEPGFGVDDYLLKPFRVSELLARIHAFSPSKGGHAIACLGNATTSLDLDKQTLTRNGVTSLLSTREFALMHALLEQPGMILSRGQLEDKLYGRELDSNSVDVLFHAVHKKFGAAVIRNVRGLGWTVT